MCTTVLSLRMSPDTGCHQTQDVTRHRMSPDTGCHQTQDVTRCRMSPDAGCHQTQDVTRCRMSPDAVSHLPAFVVAKYVFDVSGDVNIAWFFQLFVVSYKLIQLTVLLLLFYHSLLSHCKQTSQQSTHQCTNFGTFISASSPMYLPLSVYALIGAINIYLKTYDSR